MTPDPAATRVTVAYVPYTRPTGQKGHVYVDPTFVSAVAELPAPDQCAILLGAKWLTLNMSAKAFLTLIGVVVPTQEGP